MNNDNNLKEQKQKELDKTGQNTVHAAGKAAATYFGGTVGNVGYDKLSKTKLGQGIEQGVGNVIGKTPIVNQVNKGLNDVGAVDALDKAADLGTGKVGSFKGGKKFNKPTSLNNNLKRTGNRPNLNSSLNKEVPQDETPKALQNKNHNQSIRNRFNNSSYSSSYDETEVNDENEDYDDYNENQTEDRESLLENKQKMAIIKKILPIVLPILGILIVLLLLFMLLGGIGSSISSFFSLNSHKTDDPEYTYNENQKELLEAEKRYNDAILGSKDGSVKGVVATYQERYGVTLDWYLLNAVIMYRYTIESDFKEDDTNYEELLDSEIDAKFEELEKMEEGSEEGTTSNDSGINYNQATWAVPFVATMMVTRDSSGGYSADTKKDGDFYKYLIDSLFLKVYYKNFLKDNEYETRKNLVDEIYEYAEQAREMIEEEEEEKNDTPFVSSQINVNLQTCDTPYKKTTINGMSVYNNPLTNEGTSYPTYLSMYDYIKGVLMSEIGTSWFTEELKEMVKVQAILALNFIIGDNSSGFNLKNGQMYFPTQTCRQVTCDPTHGCISVSGKASYTGLDRDISGGRKIQPLTAEQNAYADEILGEVFGLVIAKSGVTAESFSGSSDIKTINYCSDLIGVCPSCNVGSCVGQNDAKQDAKNGMSYEEILDKYIDGDYEIINIKEGLYFETTGTYNGQITLNEDFHFHQGDYDHVTWCDCSSKTIRSSGCGVTATAIVTSLLTNQKHDPVEVMNLANKNGACGCNIVGTSSSFYSKAASHYGLGFYQIGKKDKAKIEQMLADLATGNAAVIARMAPNNALYKNSSGHYITLVGVKNENGKDKVLVWDPGNRKATRDNAWVDFNDDILTYANDPAFFVFKNGGA